MKHILAWISILALVAMAMSAEVPPYKKAGGAASGDLKTASSFIGPFGYGWGWGGYYPYWGGYYGWGWPYFG